MHVHTHTREQKQTHTNKHWPQTLPFQRFQVLFNSLFKVLFIFRSHYLFAIGLSPVFSLWWNLPPTLSCSPKQLDSLKTIRALLDSQPIMGLSPSMDALFQGTRTETNSWICFYRLQFPPQRGDFQGGLFPLHSPLLRESWLVSFPPLNYMLKFRGSSFLIWGLILLLLKVRV